MENRNLDKHCPYLKEIIMVFCEAFPAKKMPLEGMTSPSRCFGDFSNCPLFAELAAQVDCPAVQKAVQAGSEIKH